MYKVFYNDKLIIIGYDKKITNEILSDVKQIELDNLSEISGIFEEFIKGNDKSILINYRNEDQLWSNFRKLFTEIHAAGGIVFHGNKLLFIFRNGRWDLPKGKIEHGEFPSEAAIREVQEECGIDSLNIIRELPSTYHIYPWDQKDSFRKWMLKKTFWFEMEYQGKQNPKPQNDEGITEIEWFSMESLDEMLALIWPSLADIVSIYR